MSEICVNDARLQRSDLFRTMNPGTLSEAVVENRAVGAQLDFQI